MAELRAGGLRAGRRADAGGARHALGRRHRRGGRRLALALRPAQPLEARGGAAPAGRQHRLPRPGQRRRGDERPGAAAGHPRRHRGAGADRAARAAHRWLPAPVRCAPSTPSDYFSYLPESLDAFTADPELLRARHAAARARAPVAAHACCCRCVTPGRSPTARCCACSRSPAPFPPRGAAVVRHALRDHLWLPVLDAHALAADAHAAAASSSRARWPRRTRSSSPRRRSRRTCGVAARAARCT